MSINNDYYQQIINDYPEYVTKEQFYKIAHISKKTAQYLLQSKKVPCVESNKKTRKYKIKVSDIVAYLVDREECPEYYSLKCLETEFSPKSILYRTICTLSQEKLYVFKEFFAKEIEVLNDLLTISDISDFFGLSSETISRRCSNGEILSFLIGGKRLIPKICLIDYLSSPKGLLLFKKSRTYSYILLSCYDKTINIK